MRIEDEILGTHVRTGLRENVCKSVQKVELINVFLVRNLV